jgi:menaquinone-dependent protoporphyrinogen oxidase
MRILVLYATTEGQTRKIAHFVAERLEAAGHMAIVVDAADTASGFEIPPVDAAIIAASVHIGRYQTAIEHIVKANLNRLVAMPTAFLSVSLAAAGDESDRKDIEDCVHRFERDTGWAPGRVEHVAGAFRFTEYDFFKRWAMKYIAARHNQPTDTSRDYELTDWAALERIVDEFIGSVPA